MAFSSPPPSLLLLLLFIAASAASPAIDSNESEDMLQSLRNYGYTLFSNGISTSDLKYQLLSASASSTTAPTPNFTLFAPGDELLYSLDMAADAAVYVGTLSYHVVPNRLYTFTDLKNLPVPFLDTLLPHYAVLIGKVRDVDITSDRPSIAVVVDGVRITFPDLYVGSRIAVHGIDGILLTGLNMSRDLHDDDDHLPPLASPAPAENNAPSASQFDQNNNFSAPAPAPGYPSVSVAPASSEGDIPAEETLYPDAPTPYPYNFNGEMTSEGTPTDQNDNASPPAAAASTFSPDQKEKMKGFGGKRKQKGKANRKEKRRRRRQQQHDGMRRVNGYL